MSYALDIRGSAGDILHNVVAEGWARLRERLAQARATHPYVLCCIQVQNSCDIQP